MGTGPIAVGDDAPLFALKDQHKREHRLRQLRGRRVLLSFHPLAWTPVCGDWMRIMENSIEVLEELNCVAFTVSVDSTPSKLAWAESLGVPRLKMLSDFWPHGEYSGKMGLFKESVGFSERANVLIDEHGKVVWLKVYEVGELPDIQQILGQLRNLNN